MTTSSPPPANGLDTQANDPRKDSLIEYPSRFPIKVMGLHSEDFVEAIVTTVDAQGMVNCAPMGVEWDPAASPDAIFAEIVHMPDGRPGNVIARPALRPYEIIFWADTEQPAEYQIPVADLYVFYEQGQLKLWSRRLQRQIIPRLSCEIGRAHV